MQSGVLQSLCLLSKPVQPFFSPPINMSANIINHLKDLPSINLSHPEDFFNIGYETQVSYPLIKRIGLVPLWSRYSIPIKGEA